MMMYELRFLDSLHAALSCTFMDGLSVLASTLGNGGIVWILACVLLLLFPRTRRIGVAVALALVIEALSCAALKMMVARPRPFMIDRDIELLIPAPSDYSFPSGHTGASFAAAYAMRDGGWKLSLPAFLLTSMIAFFRMYLMVHYPSDIIAGIVLGIFCGQLGTMLSGRICRNWMKRERA